MWVLLIFCFRACDAGVICAELIPGFAFGDVENGFDQDTVWMATEDNE